MRLFMQGQADSASIGAFLRWTLPTTTDVIFIALLWIIMLGPRSNRFFLDGDPGWHVRAGQHMLETRTIPHHDIFSHTMPDGWWVAYEWGSEVIMALFHDWGGLNGLVFFITLVLAISYTLLYSYLRRDGYSFTFTFLLLVFVFAGSSFHWLARPHPISYLFVLLFSRILDLVEQGRWPASRAWWLVPIMFLWVNLHAGFIAGLLIVLTHTAASFLTWFVAPGEERPRLAPAARRIAGVCAATFAVTLANPNGYGLYPYLARYFRAVHNLNPDNELHSPSFQVLLFQPFLLAVVALIFLIPYSRHRLQLHEIATLALWSTLGFISLRNIPVMFFICTPIFARLLAGLHEPLAGILSRGPVLQRALRWLYARIERTVSIEKQMRGHLLLGMMILLIVLLVSNHGYVGGYRVIDFQFSELEFPHGAITYLQSHMPHGNVFNDWGFGGFLVYHFYPNIKVFIDGRLDMYGEDYTRQYIDLISTPSEVGRRRESWKAVFDRYRIAWVMTNPDHTLRYVLDVDPGWRSVYKDERCVVFVKKEGS